MKLYYKPGACSLVPHSTLEWIGKPFESEAMTQEALKTPEYLALNPQGSVPLLVEGDFVLPQNIAILLYLDSLSPETRIFGSDSKEGRARAFRWLAFLNSDVHKAFAPLFHSPDYAQQNPDIKAKMQDAARANILNMLAQCNEQLQKQAHLGDDFSAADIYLYVLLRWCNGIKLDYSHLPKLAELYQMVSAKPFVAKAVADEGIKP